MLSANSQSAFNSDTFSRKLREGQRLFRLVGGCRRKVRTHVWLIDVPSTTTSVIKNLSP